MGDTSLLFTIFAVDKATSVAGKVGGSFNKMALGVAAGAAVVAVKTTMMAANFQTSMLRVQTGAGELHSNMALVSNGVLDLATKTGDSSKELASALYTVESGGQHGAAGLMVLKAAAQGAKAEGADLNTVADATTSVLQDYHLKATDAALVTSQLVAATGQGKTTFEQLAGSLSAVLPIASVAHIKFADVVGAIASMTVHGMSAEQASQNLSDAIRHMQAPTIAQTKYMQQLGINSADVTDKLGERGITGTMQYLSQTILTKMGPAGHVLLGTFNQSTQAAQNVKTMVASMPAPMAALAKQFMANKISSQDWSAALKGMTPIQANQMRQFATLEKRSTGFSDAIKSGTPEATTYAAALRGVTGDATGLNVALMLSGENTAYTNGAVGAISKTTAEAGGNVKGWSEIQGTFNVRMGQAKEQVEVLGIRIGNALLPYMTKLMTVVGAGVGWFTKHKTVAKDLGIAILILAAAMLGYKIGVAAANLVDKISLAYQGAKKVAMLAAKVATVGYSVVQLALNSATWAWVAAQGASLLGWVRTGLSVIGNTVALVAYNVATTAVKVATIAWTAVQWLLNAAFIASPIGWIVLGIGLLVAAIIFVATKTTWFQTAWKHTWDFLKTIGAWFAGPFADFFTKTIPNAFQTMNKFLIKWIIMPFLNMVGTILDAAAKAFGWIPGLGPKLKTAAANFDTFRSNVNKSLAGIHNYSKTVTVTVTGNGANLVANGKITGHLADGGVVRKAGQFLVGENGPEIADLPANTTVYPNGTKPGAGGGGGVQEIHIVIHSDIPATVKKIAKHVSNQFQGNVTVALGGVQT